MRLSTTALLTIAITTSIRSDDLENILLDLQNFKDKREETLSTLSKREYQIVTDVLKALNDTELAPKIIHYLATNSTLQPIVISTIVTVLKSGLLNMTTLFNALDQSGLVTTVVQDLISDCSLYVSLFRTAEGIISDLVSKVQSAINSSKRDLKAVQRQEKRTALKSVLEARSNLDARLDLDEVVVNLLQSLANSGLASSVVKSIITDSSYIPFAESLISAVLSSNALDLGELVDAVENTNLASDLLKSILNVNTFDTVVTNAFAAFSGDCSTSSGSGSSGSSAATTSAGSSGSTSTTTTTDPCKKKRRRRRRRANYNY
ncbi:hypothetical protein CANTEDRAFT_132135 [Yamadazyma tenuis ATCC 10573]|uniref:Opaque-phase-specific protein OP4 n=1 Tax=Candida tenuis (strain ATCC 10573 / BCRC 21748 / CBS 615 / JCM 9827 / NBRC 10315 / NRRL Y-1498 / VKM Y-70) TaxID=590646 RepID=G3BDN0_CANTC|nr:uncharacterized protein CANTEDRAFT_132135 [Yamadazyma tenuis ATCC 10573]EGV61095.1 hypothetical protein CANTEDRAFT_132135 [Yamadazyma tenuis ATCC 10573]